MTGGGGRSPVPPARAAETVARTMRARLAEDVRAAAAQQVGAAPPDGERHIERLKISLAAGADSKTVAEAIRRAIVSELGRRR